MREPSKLERLEAEESALLYLRLLTGKKHGLQQAIDAVEAERERLRDLVAALCRRLDREVSGVYFRPLFRLDEHEDQKGALRVVYHRPARREYVREPERSFADCSDPGNGVDLSQATATVRVIGEQLLADDWEVDLRLLAQDDDPVAKHMRHNARRFLVECERRVP